MIAATNALEGFLGPETLAHLTKPESLPRADGAHDEWTDDRSKVRDAAKGYIVTHRATLSNSMIKKIERNIAKYESAAKWSALGAERTVRFLNELFSQN